MKTRQAIFWMAIMAAAALIDSTFVAPSVPDIVPIHWNIHGQPDKWGSKWVNLLMAPGVMLLMLALTIVLPAISPKNYSLRDSESAFCMLMVIVSGFFGLVHILLLRAMLHPNFDFSRILAACIFLMFAFLGNLMGKLRKNFWAGVRTPWTLASDRVWVATHRYAARLWVGMGILGAILTLLGVPLVAMFVFLMTGALWPVIQSYIFYRRLEDGTV
jgi:uncharacterized membrane protein